MCEIRETAAVTDAVQGILQFSWFFCFFLQLLFLYQSLVTKSLSQFLVQRRKHQTRDFNVQAKRNFNPAALIPEETERQTRSH